MRNCCVLRICRAVPAARSTRKGTFVFPECFVAETGRRRRTNNSTFLETQLSGLKDAKRSRTVCEFVHPRRSAAQRREVPMLYAILAYHVEADVMSWTPEEDAALMADLLRVHHRLTEEGRLGPAARLGPTQQGPHPARSRRRPCRRRSLCRDQGTVAGLLHHRLRDGRSRHRGGARPAPRQSKCGLRNPSDPSLPAGSGLPDHGGRDGRRGAG